ncbi:Fbox domain containing protein, partial [Acanthamoeba castellanii str. Neff]
EEQKAEEEDALPSWVDWTSLPDEIVWQIFSYLDVWALIQVSSSGQVGQSSKTWRRISQDQYIGTTLDSDEDEDIPKPEPLPQEWLADSQENMSITYNTDREAKPHKSPVPRSKPRKAQATPGQTPPDLRDKAEQLKEMFVGLTTEDAIKILRKCGYSISDAALRLSDPHRMSKYTGQQQQQQRQQQEAKEQRKPRAPTLGSTNTAPGAGGSLLTDPVVGMQNLSISAQGSGSFAPAFYGSGVGFSSSSSRPCPARSRRRLSVRPRRGLRRPRAGPRSGPAPRASTDRRLRLRSPPPTPRSPPQARSSSLRPPISPNSSSSSSSSNCSSSNSSNSSSSRFNSSSSSSSSNSNRSRCKFNSSRPRSLRSRRAAAPSSRCSTRSRGPPRSPSSPPRPSPTGRLRRRPSPTPPPARPCSIPSLLSSSNSSSSSSLSSSSCTSRPSLPSRRNWLRAHGLASRHRCPVGSRTLGRSPLRHRARASTGHLPSSHPSPCPSSSSSRPARTRSRASSHSNCPRAHSCSRSLPPRRTTNPSRRRRWPSCSPTPPTSRLASSSQLPRSKLAMAKTRSGSRTSSRRGGTMRRRIALCNKSTATTSSNIAPSESS